MTSEAKKSRSYKRSYCSSCKRTKSGKIYRSSSAKNEFKKKSGYAKGRNGYVIHHKTPLSKGGSDTPGNMQWVSKEEHKRIHRKR